MYIRLIFFFLFIWHDGIYTAGVRAATSRTYLLTVYNIIKIITISNFIKEFVDIIIHTFYILCRYTKGKRKPFILVDIVGHWYWAYTYIDKLQAKLYYYYVRVHQYIIIIPTLKEGAAIDGNALHCFYHFIKSLLLPRSRSPPPCR